MVSPLSSRPRAPATPSSCSHCLNDHDQGRGESREHRDDLNAENAERAENLAKKTSASLATSALKYVSAFSPPLPACPVFCLWSLNALRFPGDQGRAKATSSDGTFSHDTATTMNCLPFIMYVIGAPVVPPGNSISETT